MESEDVPAVPLTSIGHHRTMSLHSSHPLPGDPADAAEAYAALGWRVVPIAPGTRYPKGLEQWQHHATTDLDTIRSWWGGLYRNHGVGIVTGPGSGLWVLDIDVKDGKPGRASLEALEAEHGPLPVTVTAVTGSGGAHLFFAWDDKHHVTNFQEHPASKVTPFGEGIDVRGEGGFVVAAPTLHPDFDVLYKWVEGRDPWSLAAAPAPEWAYQRLERGHPTEGRLSRATPLPGLTADTTAKTHHNPLNNGQQDPISAADHIREQEDYRSLLETDGWVCTADYGEQSRWRRPGKTHGSHSAVLHNNGDGPLNIFSTECDPNLYHAGKRSPDGSSISLSLFDYLAATRHNGDKSAAARQIRTELNEANRLTLADIAENMAEADATQGDPFANFGAWRPVDLSRYLDGLWQPDKPSPTHALRRQRPVVPAERQLATRGIRRGQDVDSDRRCSPRAPRGPARGVGALRRPRSGQDHAPPRPPRGRPGRHPRAVPRRAGRGAVDDRRYAVSVGGAAVLRRRACRHRQHRRSDRS